MDEPSKKHQGYQRVKKIFQSAIEIVAEERAAFLDKECRGDEKTRRKVEDLLESYDTHFMEQPAVQLAGFPYETEREPTSIFKDSQIKDQFGHYKIISKIGRGGMGVVYLAQDLKLDRRVAIKFLAPKFSQDRDKLSRFIQEAKAASALNHPNILTIHEIDEIDGIHFIATEYIDGVDLSRHITDVKISLGSALDIGVQIISALKTAHQAGIIHRDIKPDNIKIRKDGLVKILDFGLVKLIEKPPPNKLDLEAETIEKVQTVSGMIMGTPNYMSPEQARGKHTDARTDIFSFGVVMYELLAGDKPFKGETTNDIIAAVIQNEPPPIKRYAADLPVELEWIVAKTLCKEPDERYQTAGELYADLEKIKKRLEFESELERVSSSDGETGQIKAEWGTLSQQPTQTLLKRTETIRGTARATASAEYVLNQIKAHKINSLLIVAVLLTGLAGFANWWLYRAIYVPVPQAQLMYDKGKSNLDDGLLQAAKNNFEGAIALDKTYVLAHAGLAQSLNELGYLEEAGLIRERANEINQSNELPLSYHDSLRLQGINKTLLLDFSSAVEAFRELAEYAPASEKAVSFLDLGKAYEQNENLTEALESYQMALTLNSQLASANLRLGMLYGRQQEYDKAETYFSKAENLYKNQQNSEGEIEVINQSGSLLSGKGNAKEALARVEYSLNKARVNEIPYQQINCLTLMSRILRSASETKQALPFAEEAVSIARRVGLTGLLAQSLKELGTVHFFLGENQEAEKIYSEALTLARENKLDVLEKRVLLQFAAFYIQEHDADEALKYIDQVQSFFEKGGYKKDMLDVLSIRGRALDVRGEFKPALELYKDLVKRADKVGDLVIKARAKKGIGTMSANLDELGEAAPALYESYAIYNSINRTFEAGYSLLAHADVSLQIGDYQKAYSSLNLAEGVAQKQKWLVPRTDLLRAKLALSERKFPEAERVAQKIIDEDTTGKILATFEARTILALAFTQQGQKEKGKKIIEHLFKEEIEDDDLPTMAGGYLIHSEIMLENALPEKAMESALKTREILKKLGKPSLEWRAWLLFSLAQSQQKDLSSAKQSAAKADEIFSTLSQKWGPEDFKSYSERPDIKYCRQLLEEFTAKAK